MSCLSMVGHMSHHGLSDPGQGLERRVLDELFVRRDAFGEYIDRHGRDSVKWTTRKEPPTESDVTAHLAGRRTIGLHLRGVDDRCRWGVFDIDAHDSEASDRARDLADRIMKELRRRGVPFIEEDSDGRGGRHLWIRFEAPVPYATATGFGEMLKSSAGCECEYFPKQSPERGPFAGGLIRLPGRHPGGSGHWSRVRTDGLGEWSTPDASVLQLLELSPTPQTTVLGAVGDLSEAAAALVDRVDGEDRVDRVDGVDGVDGDNSVSLSTLSTPPDRCALSSPPAAEARSPLRRTEDPRILECIDRTQPSGQGQRNRCLFELARHVLSIHADWTSEELNDIARRWWDRAVAVIGTKNFSTTWADFVCACSGVRQPVGATIDKLARDADALPRSAFESRFDAVGHRRLVRLILLLDQQLSTADGIFYLSCRDAGRVAGICHQAAWKFLKLLQSLGALHQIGQPTQYRAIRYKLGPALEPDRRPRVLTLDASVRPDGPASA